MRSSALLRSHRPSQSHLSQKTILVGTVDDLIELTFRDLPKCVVKCSDLDDGKAASLL